VNPQVHVVSPCECRVVYVYRRFEVVVSMPSCCLATAQLMSAFIALEIGVGSNLHTSAWGDVACCVHPPCQFTAAFMIDAVGYTILWLATCQAGFF
jgi:hypothetical protein